MAQLRIIRLQASLKDLNPEESRERYPTTRYPAINRQSADTATTGTDLPRRFVPDGAVRNVLGLLSNSSAD